MIRSAPRLETERLILRDFTRDDLDALAKTLSDPEVVRHLTGEPISREDSFRRLFMAVGQWPVLGMGMWAVERKSDRRLVGHVGFFGGFIDELQPGARDTVASAARAGDLSRPWPSRAPRV